MRDWNRCLLTSERELMTNWSIDAIIATLVDQWVLLELFSGSRNNLKTTALPKPTSALVTACKTGNAGHTAQIASSSKVVDCPFLASWLIGSSSRQLRWSLFLLGSSISLCVSQAGWLIWASFWYFRLPGSDLEQPYLFMCSRGRKLVNLASCSNFLGLHWVVYLLIWRSFPEGAVFHVPLEHPVVSPPFFFFALCFRSIPPRWKILMLEETATQYHLAKNCSRFPLRI